MNLRSGILIGCLLLAAICIIIFVGHNTPKINLSSFGMSQASGCATPPFMTVPTQSAWMGYCIPYANWSITIMPAVGKSCRVKFPNGRVFRVTVRSSDSEQVLEQMNGAGWTPVASFGHNPGHLVYLQAEPGQEGAQVTITLAAM